MKLVLPTAQHVCHVAANLRAGDAEELRLWDGSTPAQGVLASVRASQVLHTVLVSDQPAGLCGVNRGRVWLLGTDLLTASQREVRSSVRLSRAWVTDQARRFGRLFNFVWARHTAALRWLRWLGFTIEPARPMGLAGAAFHPFHLA